MKLGIICGGFSSEYEISVKSARNIQLNMPDSVDSYLVILREEGWFVEVDGKELVFDYGDFSYTDNELKQTLDGALVYIHGDPGENGKIQAYLDIIKVPYVNSGPLASQLSFNKWYCNKFLSAFGIKVADSIYLNDNKNIPFAEAIDDQLGLPVFVKPCDSGSSFGIAKVSDLGDLKESIQEAFKEGNTVIIEAFLDGVEVTCGAYRSENGVIALPLTEIVTENDFFDYEAKYNGKSQEITPARISDHLTKEVQLMTKNIYQLLNLRSIARVDYMIVDNEVYVIEVNTIPGFSNESIVPKMIDASDKNSHEVWQEIINFELANIEQ